MLFTFLTTLIVHSTKRIHETYWCSSSTACQVKRTDWILRISIFNDKTSSYILITMTLQCFWGSKWLRSNLISHKTIWHILNIKNSEFKIKKNARFFQTPFYFSFIFLDNHAHKFLGQSPSSRHQYWGSFLAKLRRCYSSNILQHWVRVSGLIYFCKMVHSRISRYFFRNWVNLNNLCEILSQNLRHLDK